MKTTFAREFLWFVIALVLSLPLGFLFLWLIGITAQDSFLTSDEEAFVVELYLLGMLVGFLGVYIVRFTADSLAVLSGKKKTVTKKAQP